MFLKKTACFLTVLTLLLSLCAFACAEESGDTQNQYIALHRQAENESAASREKIRALTEDPDAWDKAVLYGAQLGETVNASMGDVTFTLEQDAVLTDVTLVVGKNRRIVIDLNGHVLYGPVLPDGEFTLRNGTVADLSSENADDYINLTVEEDCRILCDRSPAAIDLTNAGDFLLDNRGIIQGIRRIRYQTGRGAKVKITNTGRIDSDTNGISVRSFHQNTTIMIQNDGELSGRYRGLDVHTAGGSLSVEGSGAITGVLGPDIEIPKVVLKCPVIADDRYLDPEETGAMIRTLDPYGEKNVQTGVAFDLQANRPDYWSSWQVTGKVWASTAVMRMSLPENGNMKGIFSPVIASGSPSRSASCTAVFEQGTDELNERWAERNIKEALGAFSLDGWVQNGGEVFFTLTARYQQNSTHPVILFSTMDTIWSQISGYRDINGYQWQVAENAQLPSQKPVRAKNDYYQLKGAMNAAGENGTVLIDRDLKMPWEEPRLQLLEGVELTAYDGVHAGGNLDFVIERSARLTNLDASGETLHLNNLYLSGDVVTLSGVKAGILILENLTVYAEDTSADHLEIHGAPGTFDYNITANSLSIEASDRQYAVYTFPEDIGTAFPDEAFVRIVTGSGSLRKTFRFTGRTGVKHVDVFIRGERDPEKALVTNEPDTMYFYGPYLKMFDLLTFLDSKGERPTLRILGDGDTVQHEFAQQDDGSWLLLN